MSCTRESHEELKRDLVRWAQLMLVGEMLELELRDCPICGSTLGRPVSEEASS